MKESAVAELAIKAQQGDMQAFEKLYTEFSPLVYSILLEITHDSHEAEDLTQDCFVSALKNIHTLKEPAKAKKWLTAIAANHGKDYLKKKKPALLASEHEYIFEIQEEENASVLPEESAILDERSEEIREIVNSVSEDKRLCLVLFYQHEMSITEIAEELGISEAAVKSRLFRAREDIREEVEKRNKKGLPLFGIAPLPLILFVLRKSSEAASASFAGSAAQATTFTAVTATSGAAVAASGTAVTSGAAATGTAVTTGAASTAATGAGAAAATTLTAKTVAIIVTGAVVAGGGGATVAKVIHDKRAESTTAFIEETTELSSENIAVIATREHGEITVEFESSTVTVSVTDTASTPNSETSAVTVQSSAENGTERVTATVQATKPTTPTPVTTKLSTTKPTTLKPATPVPSATQKATTTVKATTKPSTTAKPTTTKPTTRPTTKPTTARPTTTKPTTTKPTTTRPTTTKPTTTKPTTTKPTTTKPTTTLPPTTQGKATVTVTVWGEETSTVKTLYFNAGEKITGTVISDRLYDEYNIVAIVDTIDITAQAGGRYTTNAYE